MQERRALDTRATLLMLLLCVIWSLQQIAVKAIRAQMAPVLQIALRSGVAVLLVATLMRWRNEGVDWRAPAGFRENTDQKPSRRIDLAQDAP